MDKTRHKSKKDKPAKNVDRERIPLFLPDVKAIKENLKIKEILRTVKMNSSMRIKAPRGSKVMNSKDFNDGEDFEEVANSEDDCTSVRPSATNPNVIIDPPQDSYEEASGDCISYADTDVDGACSDTSNNDQTAELTRLLIEPTIQKSNSFSETTMSQIENENMSYSSKTKLLAPTDCKQVKGRDRKLSLDHTMLTRREGLSHSDLDLHSIGKSPLERKSSFFKKRMDSFFKNTTEIFKRQSLSSKTQPIHRRGSMSVSLQSLNEKTACNGDCSAQTFRTNQEVQGSASSLHSSITAGRSYSSLSVNQGDTETAHVSGCQPALTGSQPIGDMSSNSVNSLNEIYSQESLMNSRAISMSSGLDSAHGKGRRKASRSNRVTWLASEGLINYFRRQDEKYKDNQVGYSYQDFSTIPENNSFGPNLDNKGRRLSYQRAVSGEDPVIPVRYQDTMRRKPHIPENHEIYYELSQALSEYSSPSSLSLSDRHIENFSDEALFFLNWTEDLKNLINYCKMDDWDPNEAARQNVIRELICTEADYIRFLAVAVQNVFLDTMHSLRSRGFLLDVDLDRLFLNFPEVLTANLRFWQVGLIPMIKDAYSRKAPFNTDLMWLGFQEFSVIFHPYERFVVGQTKATEYLRDLLLSSPFMYLFIKWCESQTVCQRQRLSDIIAKPMQRLTKYGLLLDRLIGYTEEYEQRLLLMAMEANNKKYVVEVNRSIRQDEEDDEMDNIVKTIDRFELEFKDEEMDRIFRIHSTLDLKTEMLDCPPQFQRTLVYQADARYKDSTKEGDVKIFLLTDMILISKKLGKGSVKAFKMIRPKYLLKNLRPYYKHGKNDELVSISYVVLDEFSAAYQCFNISPPTKETPNAIEMKVWEQKYREAKLSYDYAIWFGNIPDLKMSDLEYASDEALRTGKISMEGYGIERQARERVATMMHNKPKPVIELPIEKYPFDRHQTALCPKIFRARRLEAQLKANENRPLPRPPISRKSTSADEQQPGSSGICKPSSSVEHYLPPQKPDEVPGKLTVQYTESEDVNELSPLGNKPVVTLQQPPPVPEYRPPSPCNLSVCPSHNKMLTQPQSGVVALMHSLPNLALEPTKPRPSKRSDKHKKNDREVARDQSSASHRQLLTTAQRGISHPPTKPTRASIRRGAAVSCTKQRGLSKMGHVHSLSQVPLGADPLTTQPRGEVIQTEPTPTRAIELDVQSEARSHIDEPSSLETDSTTETPDRRFACWPRI